MFERSVIEDMLFAPIIGGIYASENRSKVLYDEKAVFVKLTPLKLLLGGN